jgi:hypothetical protein
MVADPIERRNVSFVGFSDLDGHPAFKIDLQRVDGRWLLYLADFWHSGWSVVDVTDPSEPEYLAHLDGPENTFTLQVQVADGLMVTSLEQPRVRDPANATEYGLYDYDPDGDYAAGAYVWDVETDPTDPELLGQYESGGTGTHRNFYDGGDYAFMCAGPEGFEGKCLTVVDLSDPGDPEEVARWWWPGQAPDEEADERYYCHGPAYRRGDRLYLSYGSVGALVFDVADETEPELLSRLGFGDLGSWLGTHSFVPVPDTDLAVANTEAIREGSPLDAETGEPLNYTVIVDVSDDARNPGFEGQRHVGPRVVSWVPTPRPEPDAPYDSYHERPGRFGPHNQAHYREGQPRYRTSDHLVMTYFNAGLRLFDVSDPLAPTEVGHYVPEDPTERVGSPRPGSGLVSTFEDVVVDERGYVYCTDPQQGLFVLESDVL